MALSSSPAMGWSALTTAGAAAAGDVLMDSLNVFRQWRAYFSTPTYTHIFPSAYIHIHIFSTKRALWPVADPFAPPFIIVRSNARRGRIMPMGRRAGWLVLPMLATVRATPVEVVLARFQEPIEWVEEYQKQAKITV